MPTSAMIHHDPQTTKEIVSQLVRRAREAQRIYERSDQQRVDEVVTAAGWAIMHPEHNRALAEMAVRDTGLGDVDDKVQKNHRKTLGLMRDLQGARSVGVIEEHAERGDSGHPCIPVRCGEK